MYDQSRPWDPAGGSGRGANTPAQEKVDNEAVGKHMVMLPEPPENVAQLPCAAFGLDVGGLITSWTAPSIAVLGEDVMVSVQGLVGATAAVRTVLAVLDDKQLYSRSVIADGDGIAAPRLFMLGGSLWVVGSAPSQDGRRALPVVARLEGARVVQRDIIQALRQESNWMPAVVGAGDRVRFVYTTDPLVVLDYSTDGRGPGVLRPELASVSPEMGSVRGGSQLVPWGESFIALVRQVHRDQRLNAVRHVHRFARFSADLSAVTLGKKCFSFTGDVTERCGGAIVRTTGGKRSLLVAFGVGTNRSMLASVASETVDEYLL
jgi:hypothetical protein